MNVSTVAATVLALLAVSCCPQFAAAQCGCQTATPYAAPAVTAAPTTTYYAPAATVTAAPTTTYYAPAPAVIAAPTTTYYAPAPAVIVPTRTYYAPAPTYYARPVTTYYVPTYRRSLFGGRW